MRRADAGFTLFEVLGAVSILAIVYTTLSTVAIRGLRSEGESRRMLEASLIADWELTEFELELDTGVAPEIGITEGEEIDGFTVTWEVTPYYAALFEPPSTEADGARTSQQSAQLASTSSRQAAAAGQSPTPFLQVDLRVGWFEAGNERFVTRTIFAVDEDAAATVAVESVLAEDSDSGARESDSSSGGGSSVR